MFPILIFENQLIATIVHIMSKKFNFLKSEIDNVLNTDV